MVDAAAELAATTTAVEGGASSAGGAGRHDAGGASSAGGAGRHDAGGASAAAAAAAGAASRDIRETRRAPARTAPRQRTASASCEDVQDIVPSPPMTKFIAEVKSMVDRTTARVGHGSQKQGVEGKLPRGSPWVYPDDPLLAPVPDLETHYLTPVFVCMWELLCDYLVAPPCPRCKEYQHVSSILSGGVRVRTFPH